jgi:hypothetical protein
VVGLRGSSPAAASLEECSVSGVSDAEIEPTTSAA